MDDDPVEQMIPNSSDNNKGIADGLNANTKKYYGTVGYEFICWLNEILKDEEQLDNLKEIYKINIMSNSAKVTKEIAKEELIILPYYKQQDIYWTSS